MEKFKVKSATQAERCEICHLSDMFDSNTNTCQRCNQLAIIINSNATPTGSDQKEQIGKIRHYSNSLINLIYVQIWLSLIAIFAACFEVETILASGPILSVLGIIIAWLGRSRSSSSAIYYGLTAPLMSFFCLLLIVFNSWSPAEATWPMRFLSLQYALFSVPLAIYSLTNLRRESQVARPIHRPTNVSNKIGATFAGLSFLTLIISLLLPAINSNVSIEEALYGVIPAGLLLTIAGMFFFIPVKSNHI